jgi:hypothetical protein
MALTAVMSALFRKLLANSITLLGEQVAGRQIPLLLKIRVLFASRPLRMWKCHQVVNVLSTDRLTFHASQNLRHGPQVK